ncbi:MAG: FAD-dependent oxidoreductase [Candidatus Lindowbacteria bacterium]|nr:FAD-dependent oxidoreductase [Candidatus Lindowbacteria bacterium]
MQSSNKVVIIGAGIGGLASGHFLSEGGRPVEIFERARIPGGRIQLLEKDGARVDVGTQYFHTNYVETYKLLETVGLKDKLIPIHPPVEMIRNGRGYPVKHNTIRYKIVPFWSNLKFGRIVLTALRNFGRLDPYYNDPLPEFEDIELADYVLRKCDKEVLEYLVRPIICAFNLSDPEGESLAHFLRICKQFLTASDMVLPSGMLSFPQALAAKVPVTYNADVKQIIVESNQVKGVQVGVGREVRKIEAKDVICATPLKELAHLLPSLNDVEKKGVAAFKYSQFPLANFFMKRKVSGNQWAYVLSRAENFKTAYTSDAAVKCREMVPSGKSILQTWFAGEAGYQLVDESDEKIIALAKKEMNRVIPSFESEIESVEVVRHHTGMPRYQVGAYGALRDFLESIRRIKGLHLVGDYYGHSTLETVVRSARRATEKLLGTTSA